MHTNRAYILYCVLELLLGNLDVAMTDVSLGTSRQSKTHHISHSCGYTAVFLVLLGVARLCCHAFPFLLVLAVPSYTQSSMT